MAQGKRTLAVTLSLGTSCTRRPVFQNFRFFFVGLVAALRSRSLCKSIRRRSARSVEVSRGFFFSRVSSFTGVRPLSSASALVPSEWAGFLPMRPILCGGDFVPPSSSLPAGDDDPAGSVVGDLAAFPPRRPSRPFRGAGPDRGG